MTNEYINFPIGTCFKEIHEDKSYYYLVGKSFIYCNDYHCPQIRPWKFNVDECTIASEEEKNQFIEDLKKNYLIWDEETGKVEREFEDVTLNVKIRVKPGIDINKLLEILNNEVEKPFKIYGMKFENL